MPETTQPLRIFLSYAHADIISVRKLHTYLHEKGFDIWFDEEKLVPGQDWRLEIGKGLSHSDVVIVCLSETAVGREGFFQKEFRFALDRALEMPEGRIFLIPVRLEVCDVPSRLSRYQWVDLFGDAGYSHLIRGLKHCIEQLGRARVDESQPVSALDSHRVLNEDAEKKAQEKIEQDRLAREKAEARRIAEEKIEKERLATARAENERMAREKAEQERIVHQKAEAEKIAKQKAKKDDQAREQAETRARSQHRLFFLLGGLLLVVGVGYWVFSSLPIMVSSTPTSTLTATPETFATKTSAATFMLTPTKTLPPPTRTAVPPTDIPFTPTPILTPTLAAGDVMVSEKDGMKLHYVPAGPFMMGSNAGGGDEKPIHEVTLDSFWIDETEITNRMYTLCVAAKECEPPHNLSSATRGRYYNDPAYADFPVIHVYWADAKTYCEWAGRKLPTEAQWEKAARGADQRTYPWGNDLPIQGWLNYGGYVGDTTPVGTYPNGKSPYGALDMAGNVWEWVGDFYDPAYYDSSPSLNPIGPRNEASRVLRGGAWNNARASVRASYRSWGLFGHKSPDTGFRCALPAP